MTNFVKIKDLSPDSTYKYFPKLFGELIRLLVNKKKRITRPDIELLEKLGFKKETMYCRNNLLKMNLLSKSRKLYLLKDQNGTSYFCIGLSQTSRWNANWLSYQLN